MPNSARSPDSPQNEETRQALLSAAATIFVRDGYQLARIREIASLANANLSAVNYHFGNKQGLYEAVLKYLSEQAIEAHPLLTEKTLSLGEEEQFRLLVANMVLRFVDVEAPSSMASLLVREMANPTDAIDGLIKNVSKPQFAIVAGLIKSLLGPAATPENIQHCTLSLMGQVVFYLFGRPLVSRLFPKSYTTEHIAQISEHISEFSLAGIKQYRESINA